MFKFLRKCKHEWRLEHKEVMESGYIPFIEKHIEKMQNLNFPMDIFKKKYISLFTCNKCGKIKKFVEEM